MTKLRDAIYGFAVADALGVPFEFKERGTFICSDCVGFGTWNKEAGTWSDDTSMTLATCKSIKDKGRVDIEDIRKNFKAWLFDDEFTADGKTFDVGGTTREALTLNRGMDDFYSNGNGSLMRILPLAFTDASDEEIEKVSSITHAHEISRKACLDYVHLARKLIAGEKLEDLGLDDGPDSPGTPPLRCRPEPSDPRAEQNRQTAAWSRRGLRSGYGRSDGAARSATPS